MRLSARQLAARMTRRGLAWGGMVGGTGDAYPLGLIVGQDVASPSDHPGEFGLAGAQRNHSLLFRHRDN